jgi:hypothetical protein
MWLKWKDVGVKLRRIFACVYIYIYTYIYISLLSAPVEPVTKQWNI